MTNRKLPKGWSWKTLASLVQPDRKISYGIVQPGEFDPDGVLLVRGQDYSFGWKGTETMFRVSPAIDRPYRRSRLRTGDIIITIVGAGTGNIAVVPQYLEGANITQTTARVAVDETTAVSEYVRLVLESPIGKRSVYENIKGGAQPGLNIADVEEFRLPMPRIEEQRAIARCLKPWGDTLEKLAALITAKEYRKDALIQNLLTGERRLPAFDRSKGRTIKNRHGNYPADWSRVKLGKVTIESSVRADTTIGGVVLSCTKYQGLVPSEQYFGKRVYAADTSSYKVVRRGEFAYATNHIEEGSIGYQNICDLGLVSPIYTVFKTKATVDDAYFYRLLKSTLMIHLYRVNTSASVDRRGSLRYGEFSEIEVNLPDKPEQRAIAAILDAADTELRLLIRQRKAVDQQKRGLMQQLLTGKMRIAL